MDNLELMKQEISNLAKEKKEEFEKVSDYIFANPELAFKEYKSQNMIVFQKSDMVVDII